MIKLYIKMAFHIVDSSRLVSKFFKLLQYNNKTILPYKNWKFKQLRLLVVGSKILIIVKQMLVATLVSPANFRVFFSNSYNSWFSLINTKKTRKHLKHSVYGSFGGEGEIWTLATLPRPTPLAGEPLRPLGYFSKAICNNIKFDQFTYFKN